MNWSENDVNYFNYYQPGNIENNLASVTNCRVYGFSKNVAGLAVSDTRTAHGPQHAATNYVTYLILTYSLFIAIPTKR